MMMRVNFAPRNQFLPNRAGERQIRDFATMKVANLTVADAKFAPAEAMAAGTDAGPAQKLAFDCLIEEKPDDPH